METLFVTNAVRACYHFALRTVFRSSTHIQLMLAVAALCAVSIAKLVSDLYVAHTVSEKARGYDALLSVPFLVGVFNSHRPCAWLLNSRGHSSQLDYQNFGWIQRNNELDR